MFRDFGLGLLMANFVWMFELVEVQRRDGALSFNLLNPAIR